jgi:glycosyltransferase involved in cell wall biosynthesis
MPVPDERLRVAFLAGSLARGGAEKQMIYMVKALTEAGANVRVYHFHQGEAYEATVKRLGIRLEFAGGSFPVRLAVLAKQMAAFRPAVIQAAQTYTNLYAVGLGRLLRAVHVGAVRTSVHGTQAVYGRLTRWLLRSPDALVVNSERARADLVADLGCDPGRVFLLLNAIDLGEYPKPHRQDRGVRVTFAFVGRLVGLKRADIFLRALAAARRKNPGIRGVVAGSGPERSGLDRLAAEVGLSQGGLTFCGEHHDVPGLLAHADALVFCSEDVEGTPNVILEAMAASLPVITTQAGEAATLVREGVTGFVVPPGDVAAVTARMLQLAGNTAMRESMGSAGRRWIEEYCSHSGLAGRLLDIYRAAATAKGDQRLLRILPN